MPSGAGYEWRPVAPRSTRNNGVGPPFHWSHRRWDAISLPYPGQRSPIMSWEGSMSRHYLCAGLVSVVSLVAAEAAPKEFSRGAPLAGRPEAREFATRYLAPGCLLTGTREGPAPLPVKGPAACPHCA